MAIKYWKITINKSYVTSDLTNQVFQYFSGANGALAMPEEVYTSVLNATGEDVEIVAGDLVTVIPRRLIKFDSTTGQIAFDALVPSISSTVDTDIYIKVGDPLDSNPAVGAKNTAVYPSSLFGTKGAVWPLDDVSQGRDETANAFDLTISGAAQAEGLGTRVMYSFDGNNDVMSRNGSTCGTFQSENSFSMFMIMKPAVAAGLRGILGLYASYNYAWNFFRHGDLSSNFLQMYYSSTYYINKASANSTFNAGTYWSTGITNKNTPPWQCGFYRSGALLGSFTNNGSSSLQYSNNLLRVGCNVNAANGANAYYYSGLLGQVFIYTTERTAPEHNAQFRNFNSADFWSTGDVITVSSTISTLHPLRFGFGFGF